MDQAPQTLKDVRYWTVELTVQGLGSWTVPDAIAMRSALEDMFQAMPEAKRLAALCGYDRPEDTGAGWIARISVRGIEKASEAFAFLLAARAAFKAADMPAHQGMQLRMHQEAL